MNLTKLHKDFFHSEKTGGLLLIICTIISIIISNTYGGGYIAFWETGVAGHTITHWINDGLMAIFFLLIGLELEREIYIGELSKINDALFPVIAAIGGVLVPAGIYLVFNYGLVTQSGAGVPMATDIAFAIGMLALLGSLVPPTLKIFLTALAVIDDLCAIIIIAIFYSAGLSWIYASITACIFLLLLLLNRMRVHNLIPYLLGGIAMWYCMLHSGIHATLSGVLLAFAIPFGNGDEKSPSYILQHILHKPVSFVIIPLFALANTCIIFQPGWTTGIFSTAGLGIIMGLFIGKPLGITLFARAAVAVKFCQLPEDLKWSHIIGAGILAGIGFTMSIFITLLAFDDDATISIAKIAILLASVLAAVSGLTWLSVVLKKKKTI